MTNLRVLSLFSGVGGFDMGLENAGMETVFQCEIDKNCQEVLGYWWPNVPKWDDVSTLTGEYILSKVDGVDVVAWGSPCQDLSLAGRRRGLSGERSGLFHQGIRIIKELREVSNGKYPTWSIWENVPGALSSNGGADFGQVLYEMDEAGACFSEWAVLDAQYFGVPQRRRRVFVTSCFSPAISNVCPSPLLPVAQSGSGHIAPSPEQGQGNSSSSAAGFGNSGFNKWKRAELAITLSARDFKSPNTVVVEAIPIQDGRTIEKRQNGIGVGSEGDPSYTLDQTGAQAVAHDGTLLVDGRRSNDVRIYTEPVQTLEARMGTGGNNVPLITQEPIAFSHTQGLDIQPSETAWPTLRANGAGHAVAEPIVFAPGGMVRLGGNVWDGGPVPTLRAEAKRGDNEPHIAYPIQGTIIGRSDAAGPQGPGIAEPDSPMYTLDTVSQHGVAHDQEGFTASSFAKYIEGVGTLRADGGDIGGGSETIIVSDEPCLVVRRLTPLECNRLQGWPDGHTAIGVNGPISDTQQYKMCGNGVASPVAEWIGSHIVKFSQYTKVAILPESA